MGREILDDMRIDGERIDGDVKGRVLSAKLIRPYDAATSIELALDDHDFRILRSGLLAKKGKPERKGRDRREVLDAASWAQFGRSLLTFDGYRFRLAGVTLDYEETQTLTTVWEDEPWATLRRYERAVVGRRRENGRGLTRAQFINKLCIVTRKNIARDIPERDDVQPVQGNSARDRARKRRRGIPNDADVTIKGRAPNKEQIRNLETGLAVADEEGAGERATLAWIVAVIQESVVQNLAGGDADSQGILQLRTGIWGVELARSVEGSTRAFFTRGFWGKGGAIDIARDNPALTPGEIAQRVQGSNHPTLYDPWLNEAEAILAEYGGAGQIRIDRAEHEFKNPKGTPFIETMAALASEVNFRLFSTENTLHYVSDEYLIRLKPVFTIRPGAPGVIGISGDADVGMPVAELTVTASKPRWTGRAGIPVSVKEMGLLNGRWLIANVTEDLFEIDPAEITLQRPAPITPEPTDVEAVVEATAEPGSIRERIVRLAEQSMTTRTGHNYYSQPGALTTDPTAGPPNRSDCSQWVRAIYLRAGAEDPGTYTGAQVAQGTRTTDPKPGDLMFTADVGHVELYVGDGKTIGHGSPPIDRSTVAAFPGHFFVTYPSLDG
jgi:hypothetical protein